MNDNNINEEWLKQHQWQSDMPSPDMAWSDMLAKLDEEMPADHASGKGKYPRNHALYLVVLMLLLMNIKHTNEGFNTQEAKHSAIESMSAIANKQRQIPISGNETIAQAEVQIKDTKPTNLQQPLGHRTNHRHILPAVQAYPPNNTAIEQRKPVIHDTVEPPANPEFTVENNNATSIQKSKSLNPHPTDSSQGKDEDDEEKLLVQAGLQWTLPIPVAGTSNYFAGTSGTDQPWRVLLPGAWVSIKADKTILMAKVNPFTAASFNPKSFYSNKEVDSTSVLETFKSITKVFGVSGAISFQHNITGNWWAGAGLQANFWRKWVAVLITNEHNGATNTSSSSSKSYVLSKEDWQYFSKMQLYPHLQLMYRTNSYQVGLRSGVTFTSLAQDEGAKNLVFTELFFRLPLISNNKK